MHTVKFVYWEDGGAWNGYLLVRHGSTHDISIGTCLCRSLGRTLPSSALATMV
jgi:hypothetical protein